MTLSSWMSYIIACILLISPPGPTVTYLITTSMSHGKKVAYGIVWGSFWGGLLCLLLSFIGVGAILSTSSFLYASLRILGIIYLIYLGIKSLIEANQSQDRTDSLTPVTRKEAFKNGFLLIFLNPKNIIFFASFIPQFIKQEASFLLQMGILSMTYLTVGLINDYLYSFFASQIGDLLGRQSEKRINQIGGIAMILSAIIVLFQQF